MLGQSCCSGCNFPFLPSSRQFSCCNPDQKYCVVCKRKGCPICKSPSMDKEGFSPKCYICSKSFLKQEDLFMDPECKSLFCASCITRQILGSVYGNEARLQCGHKTPLSDLRQFMKKFCSSCGKKFDPLIDYELSTGENCCTLCYQTNYHKIKHLLLKCRSCGQMIHSKALAGVSRQDYTVCIHCSNSSYRSADKKQFSQESYFTPKKQKNLLYSFNSPEQTQETKKEEKYSESGNRYTRYNSSNFISTQPQQREKKYPIPSKPLIPKYPKTIHKNVPNETSPRIKTDGNKSYHRLVQCNECGVYLNQTNANKDYNQRWLCRLCFTIYNISQMVNSTSNDINNEQERRVRSNSYDHKTNNAVPPYNATSYNATPYNATSYPATEDRGRERGISERISFGDLQIRQRSYTPTKRITINNDDFYKSKQCTICKQFKASGAITLDKVFVCLPCYANLNQRRQKKV